MPLFKKITLEEKRNFIETFILLLRTGMPMDTIFLTLIEQTQNPLLKSTFEEGLERVKKGTSISQIFEENPYFGKVFAGFMKAGEESGNLEESLKYLSEWLERQENLEREISNATLYPKIVIGFAILIGWGIFYFVFPKLLPIFETFGVQLPFQTRIILFLAKFFQNYGLLFLLSLFCIFLFLKYLLKSEKVKIFLHKLALKIPFIGELIKSYQLTVISQLIYLLYKSGVTITKTLDITKDAALFYPYKESIEILKEKIIRGESLSEGMKAFPSLYPDFYLRVLLTAEQTGSFEEGFSYLSEFFASDVLGKTKRFSIILEPLILIIIAFFVGFVISAIVMPIYKITQGFYPF